LPRANAGVILGVISLGPKILYDVGENSESYRPEFIVLERKAEALEK